MFERWKFSSGERVNDEVDTIYNIDCRYWSLYDFWENSLLFYGAWHLSPHRSVTSVIESHYQGCCLVPQLEAPGILDAEMELAIT